MTRSISYRLFDTALGSCAIAWTVKGICSVSLPEATAAKTRARILRRHPSATESLPDSHIACAVSSVSRLLDGQPVDLSHLTLDESAVSEFERNVYALTRAIPRGETTTYGAIAQQIGDPQLAQRVGQALGHNPIPIITPCHRVLGANGKMVGFSAPGGIETKRKLLLIENALADEPLDLFDPPPH